jgi:hypothetical protein
MWGTRRVLGTLALAAAVFLRLMYGGLPGMTFVPTDRWGGFALTLFL